MRDPSVDPEPHLQAVAAALGQPGQPGVTFLALERALGATLGHRLFTLLRYDPGANESQRIHTSHPAAYPVGGRKTVQPTAWTACVFGRREPFIGRTADDIRAAFPDHELIRSLGCESVLNLPVLHDGQVLGTVNLLHEAGWYDEADLPLGRIFAALAVPVFLSEE
jgi:hypothetical protein